MLYPMVLGGAPVFMRVCRLSGNQRKISVGENLTLTARARLQGGFFYAPLLQPRGVCRANPVGLIGERAAADHNKGKRSARAWQRLGAVENTDCANKNESQPASEDLPFYTLCQVWIDQAQEYGN